MNVIRVHGINMGTRFMCPKESPIHDNTTTAGWSPEAPNWGAFRQVANEARWQSREQLHGLARLPRLRITTVASASTP
jgi:hypothetical protein